MVRRVSQIAERIEILRKQANLTQSDLSKRAGLSPSTVNDLVRNPDRSPSIATLQAIAGALGVPLGALVDLERAQNEASGRGLMPCDPPQGQAADGRAFFSATDTHGAAFGVSPGDVVVVAEGAPVASGALVAVKVSDNGEARICIRYLAEPYLFGFDGQLHPVHQVAHAQSAAIIGPITTILRDVAPSA